MATAKSPPRLFTSFFFRLFVCTVSLVFVCFRIFRAVCFGPLVGASVFALFACCSVAAAILFALTLGWQFSIEDFC